MDKINEVLVFGATGAQGMPVVRELLEKNIRVRAASRNAGKAKELFGNENVEAVSADLLDPVQLPRAFAGVNAAILIVPVSVGANGWEAFENALRAARQAGLQRLVFTTSGSYV